MIFPVTRLFRINFLNLQRFSASKSWKRGPQQSIKENSIYMRCTFGFIPAVRFFRINFSNLEIFATF